MSMDARTTHRAARVALGGTVAQAVLACGVIVLGRQMGMPLLQVAGLFGVAGILCWAWPALRYHLRWILHMEEAALAREVAQGEMHVATAETTDGDSQVDAQGRDIVHPEEAAASPERVGAAPPADVVPTARSDSISGCAMDASSTGHGDDGTSSSIETNETDAADAAGGSAGQTQAQDMPPVEGEAATSSGNALAAARHRVKEARDAVRFCEGLLASVLSVLTVMLLGGMGMRLHEALRESPASLDEVAVEPLRALALVAGWCVVAFACVRFLSLLWRDVKADAPHLPGLLYMAASLWTGVLVLIGIAAAHFGMPGILGWIGWLLPVAMILVAVDVGVFFILDWFRPRRADECGRPAFEARSLMCIFHARTAGGTVRQALKYQFGFDVSGSGMYAVVVRGAPVWFALGGSTLLVASMVHVVEPEEQAVVYRFGALREAVVEPGMHWKAPWPVDRAVRYAVTPVRRIHVGSHRPAVEGGAIYQEDVAILWSNLHGVREEEYLIVSQTTDFGGTDDATFTSNRTPQRHGTESGCPDTGRGRGGTPPPDCSRCAGGTDGYSAHPDAALHRVGSGHDAGEPEHASAPVASNEREATLRARDASAAPSVNLMGGDIYVEYRIDDLLLFVRASADTERLFAQFAEAEASREVLRHDIDALLGAGRLEAEARMLEALRKVAQEHALGVEVLKVGMAGTHPPVDVADAFHETIIARQERLTEIEDALAGAAHARIAVVGSEAEAFALSDAISELEQARDPEEAARLREMTDRALLNAGGQVAEVMAQARGYRWWRENEERGKAERFLREVNLYKIGPTMFPRWQHLATLERGLKDARKFVLLAERERLVLHMNFLKEVLGTGATRGTGGTTPGALLPDGAQGQWDDREMWDYFEDQGFIGQQQPRSR